MSSPKDDQIIFDIKKMNIEDAFNALGGDTGKLQKAIDRVWMKSKKPDIDGNSSPTPIKSGDIFASRDKRYTGD
jgi:hypothetical protein